MNSKYGKLFEPITLTSGVKLDNRIMLAPMTTHSAFENGMISNDELAYYEQRAGGVGAVITACAYVTKEGKAFSGGFSAASDRMIPGLTKLANTIKSKGSKAILQLFHGGRMVRKETIGGKQPISASAIPALRDNADTPKEMTEEEILTVIKGFGEATRRAIVAGFDGIELHGANTYLIQQFFSPHSNRRTDKWGGDVNKRMTFPIEVMRTVNETVKKFADKPFLIGYRISPEEIEEPGITFDDTLKLTDSLVKENIDYIHLSLGTVWRGSIRNKEQAIPLLKRLKDHLGDQVPVVGVGSIKHPDEALEVLEDGIDLVALGRELIVDPQWVEKVQSGNESSIRQSMSIHDQEELVIPSAMWENITSLPGWLPIVEHKNNKPWIRKKD
jgi:2,4-dienoyl-CoA reductase-like NADH-dependent reductase (Old Yellow Enzyme family)